MDKQKFSYFLNERRALLVVSWVGELEANDSEAIEKCSQEVKKSPCKYVIVNLQGVTGYDPVLAGPIVKFQDAIRNKPSFLVLTELSKDLREKLATKGLIREGDIMNTIKDALQLVLTMGLG